MRLVSPRVNHKHNIPNGRDPWSAIADPREGVTVLIEFNFSANVRVLGGQCRPRASMCSYIPPSGTCFDTQTQGKRHNSLRSMSCACCRCYWASPLGVLRHHLVEREEKIKCIAQHSFAFCARQPSGKRRKRSNSTYERRYVKQSSRERERDARRHVCT